MKTLQTFVFALILFLVTGCIKNIKEKEEKKEIQNIVSQYESENWLVRKEAVIKASKYKNPVAEDLIIHAIDDTHTSVRLEAIQAVSAVKSIKGKKELKRLVDSDADKNIKWYAIKSLSDFHDPTCVPAFVKGLTSQDWLVREESIKALLKINDETIINLSVPYIIKALEDTNINVVISALENITIKDARIYNKISAFINSKNIDIKIGLLQAALHSLKGYELDKRTKKNVIKLLTHSNKDIRLLCLAVLKEDKELQNKDK